MRHFPTKYEGLSAVYMVSGNGALRGRDLWIKREYHE